MKKDQYIEPTDGVLTERMDSNTKEFDQLQAILLNKAREQSEKQKRIVELMALKFKMEDYINSAYKGGFRLAGEFLKAHLKVLKIQQNKFADYINIKPSNFSKLLKGERPINFEMAIIIGKIFNQNPMIWLEIQTKNELIKLSKSKSQQLKKYSLDDLVEKEKHRVTNAK